MGSSCSAPVTEEDYHRYARPNHPISATSISINSASVSSVCLAHHTSVNGDVSTADLKSSPKLLKKLSFTPLPLSPLPDSGPLPRSYSAPQHSPLQENHINSHTLSQSKQSSPVTKPRSVKLPSLQLPSPIKTSPSLSRRELSRASPPTHVRTLFPEVHNHSPNHSVTPVPPFNFSLSQGSSTHFPNVGSPSHTHRSRANSIPINAPIHLSEHTTEFVAQHNNNKQSVEVFNTLQHQKLHSTLLQRKQCQNSLELYQMCNAYQRAGSLKTQ